MKIAAVLLLVLIFGVAIYELGGVILDYGKAKNKFSDSSELIGKLEKENEETDKEIKYFSNPDNLLKELRSKFNYRFPGEKFIIVVPKENQ
jgi:cell division protein FtsB